MKAVYCSDAMVHWGRIASEVLNRPLYTSCYVGDVDEVFILGMYDAPYYQYSIELTKRAKKRHIHWCGSDVQTLYYPGLLPDATHTCESEWLRQELLQKGVDAQVATLPSSVHLDVSPLPEVPTVSAYFGSIPEKYGASMVKAIAECLPDVPFCCYPYQPNISAEKKALEIIPKTTVHLRLTQHDGSAVSPREYMEAGRYVVCTANLPYAKQVRHDDLPGILAAIKKALKNTEPDYEAAAYYKEFNAPEHFLAQLKEAGIE